MKMSGKWHVTSGLKAVVFVWLAIGSGLSVGAAELKDFFTGKELSIMDKAHEIQQSYFKMDFVIRQIMSPNKALVSCEGEDCILYADFAGKVDGERISAITKDGGAESYATVTGAKRTVKASIAISQNEMDILEKSKPLFARRRLVEEELYRQEGELLFQANSANLKAMIDDLDRFIADAGTDKTSRFYNDVQLLVNKKHQQEEYFIKKEYHGPAITEQTLADQKAELSLLALSIAREKADREKAEEIRLQKEEEKRALLAKQDAEQRVQLAQKAAEQKKQDEESWRTWTLKANTYLFLCRDQDDVWMLTPELYSALSDYRFLFDTKICPGPNETVRKMNEVALKSYKLDIKGIQKKIPLEALESVLGKLKEKYPGEYLSAEKKAQEAAEKSGQ